MTSALAIDRGDKLEDLDDKAQNLSNEASIFNKRAKQTRRQLIILHHFYARHIIKKRFKIAFACNNGK